jgi:DNA-dependent protein kinase catalytic subunit
MHVCRDKDVHIHEQYLQAAYRNYIQQPKTDVGASLERCYQVFANEDLSAPFRCAVIQRVLCSLLRHNKSPVNTDFFASHISDLCARTSEKLKPDSSLDLPSQLMIKSACFSLFEVMYGTLPVADVHAPGAKVNKAFCGEAAPSERGSDLTKFLCGGGGLFGALTETHLTSTGGMLADLRRNYHCAAYNALASLISSTQTDPKFFSGFLFKETPTKAERMFDNLVDCQRYVLPQIIALSSCPSSDAMILR